MSSDKDKSIVEKASESDLNPAGAARRRLIRAIGTSGSATIAALVASGWKKPLVEFVAVPAHAQLTNEMTTGCSISVVGSVPSAAATGLSITLSLIAALQGGSTAQIAEIHNFYSISGTTTFPTGTHNIIFLQTGYIDPFMGISVMCCDATNENGSAPANGVALSLWVDDGQCSFPI